MYFVAADLADCGETILQYMFMYDDNSSQPNSILHDYRRIFKPIMGHDGKPKPGAPRMHTMIMKRERLDMYTNSSGMYPMHNKYNMSSMYTMHSKYNMSSMHTMHSKYNMSNRYSMQNKYNMSDRYSIQNKYNMSSMHHMADTRYYIEMQKTRVITNILRENILSNVCPLTFDDQFKHRQPGSEVR